jgi:hypothetical protein
MESEQMYGDKEKCQMVNIHSTRLLNVVNVTIIWEKSKHLHWTAKISSQSDLRTGTSYG